MAASRMVVYIDSESELGQVLRDAADSGESFIIDTDDAQYEVDIHARVGSEPGVESIDVNADDDTVCEESTEDRDPLLNILGIFSSGEPNNDVAQDKYRYLTDAYLSDHK